VEQRLSIITLAVADLDRSRRFYRDVFGWRETDGSSDQIVFFQLPGIMFALYPQSAMADEHDGPVGAPAGFTLAYNVNSADEVDRVYAEVTSRGAVGLKAPESVFWGGYSAYVCGPDGEQWEIAHNPFTPVNDDGTFGHWA
jgi:catechol 2,3-dioxygenase-like lactoylglutathione lyase family enzyme